MTTDTKIIIFIGRPGSGKGTQAKMLAEYLKRPFFSSGGHFKELIDAKGPLSEPIRKDYEHGQLSPDWLAAYFFEQAILDGAHESGMVCEGFPRSLPQAHLADEIFTWLGQSYKVIYLAVSEESALDRQLSRAKVESRPDSDAVDKVRTRFGVYRARTEPVVDFFKQKGVLIEINGEHTPEVISTEIHTALGV
ncbi:hypothetical protein EXS57_02075 [Candidatus Kaiserbacteria bacterium]|nr:hypothetical protein [Candidatus Kaiserbacteria bacterium]